MYDSGLERQLNGGRSTVHGVKRSQLRWFGHLMRTPPGCIDLYENFHRDKCEINFPIIPKAVFCPTDGMQFLMYLSSCETAF